jgi:uncharacterized membrane protein YccC
MTVEAASSPSARSHGWSRLREWLRAKDPAHLALKRSVRAAVTMPSVFGLTHALFSNPQVSLFGAFGSFALLLLVDFPGRPRVRLVSYLSLVVAGSCLIALGTVVSTHKVAAVVVMALVGFGVLFAGIASPSVATASTATLLLFVLPVAVAQPAAAVGPRLLGWAFASTFCTAACMAIWPTPWHDNLRRRLSATISAVRLAAQSHAEGRSDPAAQASVQSELSQLRAQFSSTPYPPAGSAGGTIALAKLVGRVEWVAGNAALTTDEPSWSKVGRVRKVIEAVADTLLRSASLICDGEAHPVHDPVLVEALQASIRRLDELMGAELDSEVSMLIEPDGDRPSGSIGSSGIDGASPDLGPGEGIASSLDPSFQARGLGIATEMLADAALEAAGAQPVGDRRLGTSADARSLELWRRLISYLSFRSVWFRNAVRGSIGLALAVAVVEITDVEHGFWVVLGTLSVLRSNALGTGATAVRAIGGTTVGFLAGSAITIGVGGHPVVLWVLLPLAVLVSGVAPSMISFAAGQAGFTLVVIILFNIIEPTGWKVGLTRIEDVAIGCGVSIVVGVLFWPRGATAALGRALSEAFVTSSGYLADAVDRLTAPSRQVNTEPAQKESHRAYLRLDDAFRQFLGERGAKVMSVDTVSNLVTGSNRIRLAAFTLGALQALAPGPGQTELESVAIAGAVLRDSYASSHRWYEEFGELLSGRRDVLDPLPAHDEALHGILRRAFDDVRARQRSDRLRTILQMLWADELLEAQRQVQADLADAAGLFASRRTQSFMI